MSMPRPQNDAWLGFRGEFVNLLVLAWPMLGASLADLLLGIVDTAIVGHYGALDLAGVAAGLGVYNIVMQVVGASYIGFQIQAAQRFGRNDAQGFGETWMHSAALMLALSIVGMLVLAFPAVLAFIARNERVGAIAADYMRIRGFALPFFSLTLLLRSTFNTRREPKWGMRASLLANLVNVALAYILVYGIGPIPAMGAKGSALGSALATVISCVYLSTVFVRRGYVSELALPVVRWSRGQFRELFGLSGPEMVSTFVGYVGNTVSVALVGAIGANALAGSRIADTVQTILFVVSFKFGESLQILLSQALGRNDIQGARRIARYGNLAVLIAVVVPGLLALMFPALITTIFTNDQAVEKVSYGTLAVVGISAPLMALTTSAIGILRSLKRTAWLMYINIGAFWLVQIPLAWILGIRLNLGLPGIYTSFLVYYLIRAVASQAIAWRDFARKCDATA